MKRMEELLSNPQNPEVIARAWPVIKEVLDEQQRIMSHEDDLDSKELRGFVKAYRALETFRYEGEKSIEASKQSNKQ